jgi:starch synthase
VVLVSHPTGNANVRNLLLSLDDNTLLSEYWTTVAVFEGGFGATLSRLPLMSTLKRRQYPEEVRDKTRASPLRECVRMLALKSGLRWLARHEKGWASIDAVIRSLDSTVARRVTSGGACAVYAYEDCALETFRAARTAGLKRIYEHPVGYWRVVQRIMQEESEREPDWAATMQGLADSPSKLARKDEELSLAEYIIVPSSFSRESLKEFPGRLSPIKVVPYGAPSVCPLRVYDAKSRSEPLKVLFVGGLGQMKGLSYLFRAVEMLGQMASLTVIGRRPSHSVIVLERALESCRWIESLPHGLILQEMAAHDVLVFPSLSEGFGMVITEALSQGLPVITTRHTCGPDVLTEGGDGFIVPIRDSHAIADKLELLHRDRERLAAMSETALRKAQTLTWESYRKGVASVVREALASQ